MERIPSWPGVHRGPRRPFLRVLAAGALACAAAAPLSAQEAGPAPNVVYDFQVTLAPISLQGSVPLRLELPGEFLDGSLEVATDVKGNVRGSVVLGGTTLDVSGRVRLRDGGNSVRLLLKGGGRRIRLQGVLQVDGFAGTASGHGDLAPGKNTFVIDLSSVEPTVADVTVVIPPGGKSRLRGDATVDVAGEALAGRAVRRAGDRLHLDVRAGAFRWTGSGPAGAVPGEATVSWKARGFGAVADGAGLDLDLVPPPSGIAYASPSALYEAEEPATPNVPSVGGGPVALWSVSPGLPAGLSLDAATGTISGTPATAAAAATYTVTAANLAGTAEAALDLQVRGNRAYSFAPQAGAPTDAERRHFLMRTHFGVKASELASVQSAGLPAYVDDMLDFRSGTAVETAAFPELVNGSDPPGYSGGFPNGNQISRWWSRIMVETDRPFQEAMAFFWHDHMPVAWDVFGAGQTHFEVDYVNMLRHQGSGNLRDLLLAVSRDPGMLVYLSGFQNSSNRPNENFAREFWELFTLGVDNGYTQADIVQAARAFTGWQLRATLVASPDTYRYYMQFNPSSNVHDTGSKTFFGSTIPGQVNKPTDDFDQVVDITLAQRPVAEFVTRKIFEYFCYESPPQSLVDEMAAVLRGPAGGPNWELKPFLKALFTSEAFFSSRSRLARVKSPLESTVGLIRSTGLRITYGNLDFYLSSLGQRPGLPPTVNGWPLGTLWYSPDALVNRANLAYTVVGSITYQNGLGINVADILPPAPERTSQTVIDAVADLLRVDLTAAEEASLDTYLNTTRQSNGVIVPSAFDGSNQTQLDERVRGLLYILAQHPNFQVK